VLILNEADCILPAVDPVNLTDAHWSILLPLEDVLVIVKVPWSSTVGGVRACPNVNTIFELEVALTTFVTVTVKTPD
jgi:hypothetical protein